MRRPVRQILCGCAAALLLSGSVFAQGASYPSKPVMVIVPFPGGGPVDAEVRLYAGKLTQALGHPFVLESKPGAGTTIGTAYVAKASPDGHTLLAANSSLTIAPAFYPTLPYDTLRDLAPVSLMSKRSTLLLANASMPFNNVKEYIAYARANPGKINMGTVGAGGALHLSGAWLHSATNTKVTFVHYKGAAAMYPDLFAGRAHVAFITFSTSIPHIKAGKLKALALATTERSPLMPDMPTISEELLPGFEYSSWIGILAPARTPPGIVTTLNAELVRITKAPDILKKMTPQGTIMIGNTPSQFRDYIATETNRWQKLVKETGIKRE